MKIEMLRDEKGSIDGFTVNVYKAGSKVDLPEDLAEAFVSIGAAEVIKENRVEPEVIETPERREAFDETPVEIPEQPKKAWRKS